METRVVLYMISRIKRDDKEFRPQKVYLRDLMEEFDIDSPSMYGERAHQLAEKLMSRYIEIPQDDGGWERHNVIRRARYIPKKGCLELNFNDEVRPFLLEIKNRFTKYGLRWVTSFNSAYSIRLYELLKQFDDIGYRVVKIDDLRRVLRLEDKYDRFYDLKRYVLDKAKEDINRYSDLEVEYKKVKEGRRIHAVKFRIDRYKRPYLDDSQLVDQLYLEYKDDREPDELESWFSDLPEAERHRLWEEAEEAVKDDHQGRWREVEIWNHIREKMKVVTSSQ